MNPIRPAACPAITFLVLWCSCACGQTPEIVAVQQPESLRVGADVVAQVTPQDLLTVISRSASNPGWLWVRTEKSGWIALEKVSPVPPDELPASRDNKNEGGEAEQLAGWLTGANAGLMHEQVGILAELLQASPSSRDRVMGRAELLVQHCDRTLARIALLNRSGTPSESAARMQELLAAIRTEAQTLRDFAREGSSTTRQQFTQATQRAQSLIARPTGTETTPGDATQNSVP